MQRYSKNLKEFYYVVYKIAVLRNVVLTSKIGWRTRWVDALGGLTHSVVEYVNIKESTLNALVAN
jgi:hypothetical protein